MPDRYRLQRFVDAQDYGGTYERAVAELREGEKVSHWMWFVFPQIAGLGGSATARTYAISGLAEANAYVEHPVLGPRLKEATQVVAALDGRAAERVFGSTDAMKLRSCMTLFAHAAPDEPLFRQILDRYFAGDWDVATERLL